MPTRHSGLLIQSTFGRRGNFELVVASPMGGLAHCWRSNDVDGLPWDGPVVFGSGEVLGVSLIQSNFGGARLGNLEVVARVGDRLAHYWREGGAPQRWFGPEVFAAGVAGNPALIQSRSGEKGHFEVVVPAAGGGIAHYWRDNDDPELPWKGPTIFGAELGRFDAVALLQSDFGRRGHLEVIASLRFQSRQRLAHFWRGADRPWQGPSPVPLPDGFEPAAGVPGFIQSRFGERGNFELVVPLAGGGMAHLSRDNDRPAQPWSAATRFGSGEVEAVALMQSNFGQRTLGNLEVAARSGDRTATFWRSDQAPFAWSAPAWVCDEPRCVPQRQGEWRVPFLSGVVGVHAALLPTGKALFFSYKEIDHEPDEQEEKHGGSDQRHGNSSVLDPETGSLEHPFIDKNPFCSGHAFLADGRLLVAGGHVTGVGALHTFTPAGAGGTWRDHGNMSGHRWYPTCTTLPDGRIFILSGTRNGGGPQPVKPVNDSYEIFDPEGGLKPPRPAPFLNDVAPYSLYPFVFVLPSGKLLIHVKNETRFWDVDSGRFDEPVLTAVRPEPRTYPLQGTCVLLPLSPKTDPPYRARVMVLGGGGLPPRPVTPATNTCEILDLGASPLKWRPAAAMSAARVMPDAVLLPDGTVLVVSGSHIGMADAGVGPVFETELYDPASGSWTSLCPMRVPRLYHSTALLLPDGRVLTAGKDEAFNPAPFNYPERRIEIFSPPYLFRGARPRVTGVPSAVGFGTRFAVETPDARTVTSAALIRPGAVTHSFNQDQRYVELAVVSRARRRVRLEAPPDGKVAPPGHYMLFLLNRRGVPSIARFVRLQ